MPSGCGSEGEAFQLPKYLSGQGVGGQGADWNLFLIGLAIQLILKESASQSSLLEAGILTFIPLQPQFVVSRAILLEFLGP